MLSLLPNEWVECHCYPSAEGLSVYFRDVTDRKRAEEELRDTAERLARSEAVLAQAGAMAILRHAQPGSEQARRAQAVIERQTEHLTRIVDDLLDVTRIARGKIELRRDRVDLRLIVSRAAEDVQQLMEERGVQFTVESPDARVWADADGTRIAQLVGNLLHNRRSSRGAATPWPSR